VREVRRRLSGSGLSPRATGALLAAKYDETAEHWHDRFGLLGYPRAYEDRVDRLLATGTLCSRQNGWRVLDCGVGSRAFDLTLAGKVTASLRVEVVALSLGMLLRACLDLDRAGIENRVHLRDAKDLPFENDTFDAVIGAHVLEHLDDLFAGLP
jgi:ubiquinone/menaquinone biosynthesis C-methylase UbiE